MEINKNEEQRSSNIFVFKSILHTAISLLFIKYQHSGLIFFFTFQDIISFPTVTAAIATFQSEVAAFTSSLHLKAVELE